MEATKMEATKNWIRPAALFLVAFLVTPFLYTGLFRALPFYASFWPFFVGLLIAVVVAIRLPRWRPAAIGVALASITHAVFVAYLFMTMGSID